MTRSNCWWWAFKKRRSLERVLHAGPGFEIYTLRRRGRYIRWIPHWLVGMRSLKTGEVRAWSFVPTDPREYAFWELPALLWHKGRVISGDDWRKEPVRRLPTWKRAVSAALIFAAGAWLSRVLG